MAQILKPELREKIIESAKLELYNAGFEGAKMRRIASSCHITVGNLYRYFENKDDLYDVVVGDVYLKVNQIIERNTQMMVSIYREIDVQSVEPLMKDKNNAFVTNIIKEVVQMFSGDRLSLIILLKDVRGHQNSKMRYSFVDWIGAVLKKQETTTMIAEYLAHSFVEGIIKIAEHTQNEEELATKIEAFVKFYFIREVIK